MDKRKRNLRRKMKAKILKFFVSWLINGLLSFLLYIVSIMNFFKKN